MSDKEVIEILRSEMPLCKGKITEAYLEAILKLELLDRVGAVMPQWQDFDVSNVWCPEDAEDKAKEIIDYCTAAIAGKVDKIPQALLNLKIEKNACLVIADTITDLLLEGDR